MTDKGSTSSFGTGFLVGAFIGLTIGILYAPRPGKETRQQLKEKAEEVKEKAEEVKEKAEDIIEKARDQAEEIINKAKESAAKIKKKEEGLPEIKEEAE